MWVRSFFNKIIDVSFILDYQYNSMYCESLFLVFPASCKSAIISSLMKKQGLDSEILENYRPVVNLSFISKIIEKAIVSKYIVI